MKNMGDAIMGTGIAQGEEKAILAAQEAINSPLLQNTSIKGARGLLVNVSGSQEMTMKELNTASSIIYEEAGEDANVILGCVIDADLKDEIRITVIATGLNDNDYPEFYDSEPEIDFKEKYSSHSTSVEEELPYNNLLEEDNKEKIVDKEIDEDLNLDIPTYLRNSRSLFN